VQFGDLGVGAEREPPGEGLGGSLGVAQAVEQSQVLGRDPGGRDLTVGVTEVEPAQQPGPGQVGVMVVAAAQHSSDAVERVAGAAAVPEGLLLDAAADLVDGVEAELDDVESVEDAGRSGQVGAQGAGVAAERVQRCDGDSRAPPGVSFP
jgi:hypothetical protein